MADDRQFGVRSGGSSIQDHSAAQCGHPSAQNSWDATGSAPGVAAWAPGVSRRLGMRGPLDEPRVRSPSRLCMTVLMLPSIAEPGGHRAGRRPPGHGSKGLGHALRARRLRSAGPRAIASALYRGDRQQHHCVARRCEFVGFVGDQGPLSRRSARRLRRTCPGARRRTGPGSSPGPGLAARRGSSPDQREERLLQRGPGPRRQRPSRPSRLECPVPGPAAGRRDRPASLGHPDSGLSSWCVDPVGHSLRPLVLSRHQP